MVDNVNITPIKTTLEAPLLGVSYSNDTGVVEQLWYDGQIITEVLRGGYEKGETFIAIKHWNQSPEMIEHVQTFLYGRTLTQIEMDITTGMIVVVWSTKHDKALSKCAVVR